MNEPDRRYTLGAFAILALGMGLLLWPVISKAQEPLRIAQDQFTPGPEPKVSVTRVYPFMVPLAARVVDGKAVWGSGLGLSYRTSDGKHSFLSSWLQASWRVNYGHPNAVEVAWKVNLR